MQERAVVCVRGAKAAGRGRGLVRKIDRPEANPTRNACIEVFFKCSFTNYIDSLLPCDILPCDSRT